MFSPLPLPSYIKSADVNTTFDKGIILVDGFHSNMGHLLWDFMYPSWYGLFFHQEHMCNADFQWMTMSDIDLQNGGWHLDILEKFSGNPITTLNIFKKLHNIPIRIPYLISGINIGIGCVNNDLTVKRQLTNHINDPIEAFVNRMYLRYNIKRNIVSSNTIHTVTFINNKRHQYGIENMFNLLEQKYKIYNFKIIDWTNYNFSEQLTILNNTSIMIVGVGTARANSPFLPNGAIEIQTNDYSFSNKKFIQYFDYHIGTLSKYIKVIHIPFYTKEEAQQCIVSQLLMGYVEDALYNLPCKCPINLSENIPIEVRDLEYKVLTNPDVFKIWRMSGSNNIMDLINILY